MVRVDNTTGIVDVVPVYAGGDVKEEAITRYFLTHYLTVCERFDFATAESGLRGVRRLSFRAAQSGLVCIVDGNQPVISSQYLQGRQLCPSSGQVGDILHTAQAACRTSPRYATSRRCAKGVAWTKKFTHWVATVQYAYADPAKDPKTRRWNPLGFKILDFKSEPEVMVEPVADKESRHDQ